MFGMTCSEVVAELRKLEDEGVLTGILDDRGKVRGYCMLYFACWCSEQEFSDTEPVTEQPTTAGSLSAESTSMKAQYSVASA
jgi:hypothetical protein